MVGTGASAPTGLARPEKPGGRSRNEGAPGEKQSFLQKHGKKIAAGVAGAAAIGLGLAARHHLKSEAGQHHLHEIAKHVASFDAKHGQLDAAQLAKGAALGVHDAVKRTLTLRERQAVAFVLLWRTSRGALVAAWPAPSADTRRSLPLASVTRSLRELTQFGVSSTRTVAPLDADAHGGSGPPREPRHVLVRGQRPFIRRLSVGFAMSRAKLQGHQDGSRAASAEPTGSSLTFPLSTGRASPREQARSDGRAKVVALVGGAALAAHLGKKHMGKLGGIAMGLHEGLKTLKERETRSSCAHEGTPEPRAGKRKGRLTPLRSLLAPASRSCSRVTRRQLPHPRLLRR